MREILGYTPIEPDGSVRVCVTANVAFQLSVHDRAGRRIFPIHRAWLQLRPGEVLTCNGCHTPNTNPATRARPQGPVRKGMGRCPRHGRALPGYRGALFTRCRRNHGAGKGARHLQQRRHLLPVPSVDIRYADEWTEPTTAGRPKMRLSTILLGASAHRRPRRPPACTQWASTCRIVVNLRAAHPSAVGGNPHHGGPAPRATTPQQRTTPRRCRGGQLDLTDGASDEEPLQFRAYRELLFSDRAQELTWALSRTFSRPPSIR